MYSSHLIMQIIQTQNVQQKQKPLTCAEMGMLLASYTFSDNDLDLNSNVVYLGALLLFDLYDLNLIDLYFRLDKKSISIKKTDQNFFKLLEGKSHSELAMSLIIVPLVQETPKDVPEVHKQIYAELLRMSYMFGEPVPILCHDYLVCCKTSMFLNMQMLEGRAWLVVTLDQKEMLTFAKNLTESGQNYCLYLAEKMNQLMQGEYMKKESAFPQFDSEESTRNVYVVSQLLIHLGAKQLKRCSRISVETHQRQIHRQQALGDQIGALLRQPELKLHPENQESWFVAMAVAFGLVLEEALYTCAGQL